MKERDELICNDDISYKTLYYLENGYKLRKCKLCKRLFFTISDRAKYCPRIGQNERYPFLSCVTTAQRIGCLKRMNEQNKKTIY